MYYTEVGACVVFVTCTWRSYLVASLLVRSYLIPLCPPCHLPLPLLLPVTPPHAGREGLLPLGIYLAILERPGG